MTTFLELAADRYSVRSFSPRTVEPEKMARILEAGRLAPTACNFQPQRIKVITSAEELAMIDACTPCRFGAPAVLLVCYDGTACWTRSFDGADSGEVDVSIVTTHMMLAAHEIGLGTCWVMHFDPEGIAELFALPRTVIPVVVLPVGYPAEDSVPTSHHSSRMPLNRILFD
jgi:nitroreductase